MILWLQQLRAMFVKRFYNSLRFYGAVVSQLFLPLLFVLFALIVVVTAPDRQGDDQPRLLRLNDSSPLPENTIVFFAQFGSVANLDLSVSFAVLLS